MQVIDGAEGVDTGVAESRFILSPTKGRYGYIFALFSVA